MGNVNLSENLPDPSAVVLIPKDVSIKRACIATNLEKNLTGNLCLIPVNVLQRLRESTV